MANEDASKVNSWFDRAERMLIDAKGNSATRVEDRMTINLAGKAPCFIDDRKLEDLLLDHLSSELLAMHKSMEEEQERTMKLEEKYLQDPANLHPEGGLTISAMHALTADLKKQTPTNLFTIPYEKNLKNYCR